jgi:hypothetical protein
MRGKRWPQEQDALVVRYYRRKEVQELAAMTGRSVQAVMNRASGLGISRRSRIERREKEAERMSLADVEAEIERCEDMILQLCKPGNIGLWSAAVAEYHALLIKRCRMTGKQPEVMHGRTDYII